METGIGNEVDGELPQIRVELTRESEAASETREGTGDDIVQVNIRGSRKLQGPVANIVKGFVIDAHDIVGVLN